MHRCIYGIVHPDEYPALRTVLEKSQTKQVSLMFNPSEVDFPIHIDNMGLLITTGLDKQKKKKKKKKKK